MNEHPTKNAFLSRCLSKIIVLLPFFLPLYLLRFKLLVLPTTVLECVLLTIILLFSWTRGMTGWREGWKRIGRWQTVVIAWFLVTFAAVLWSPSVLSGLGLWRAYVLEPLLLFVVMADVLREEKMIERLRRNVFLVVPMLALWAIVQFATGWGIPHPWNVAIALGRRATGPFPFPNALSLFAAPIGAWAFTRWLADRSSRVTLLAWTSSLVAIGCAKSEGGFIALLSVALLALLLKKETRRWTMGAIVAVFLTIMFVPKIQKPIVRELSFHGWSGQVRLTIWKEARTMLRAHPFLGVGFGGYPTAILPFRHAKYIEVFQYPHNILLNFWSETGALGVTVFAWIVVTWMKLARQTREPFVSIAPLLVILIHGLVDVPYFKNDLAVLFWIFVFLTTVCEVQRLDPKVEQR